MEKQPPKPANPKASAKPAVPAKPAPVTVPPMFRGLDWLTLAVTVGVVWAVYLWTLAPELTLEDSGELCTGSFYAGIPHPPGYPFWAIYSWFWTFILPFGNVAWRVEVGESFAAAMGCGMVALMVSRGSSMLIEGIEELKTLPREWENSICVVAGFASGTLLGMDGFMWKESVAINRISLFGVPCLIAVMLLLMRWMYAPQQRRYLYMAMFMYGICATIHQTLLLSAMGIEVLIACVQPRLGRDMFLFNSAIYLVCLILLQAGNIPALNNMTSIEIALFHMVGVGSILACGGLAISTRGLGNQSLAVFLMGIIWCSGLLFYLYEAISGMTDPPMQWGYPRTVEGFFHALGRGQYETAHGVDVFSDPRRFLFQLWYIIEGLSESYSWVYMFVGLLPFVFLRKMNKRERSWIIGITSIYICLSVLLGILMNVSPDRQSSDLCKVFYTASHGMFALLIGYGLTLLVAYVATHYASFRKWGLVGGAVAVLLAVYCLVDVTGKLYLGPAGSIHLSELPHYLGQAFAKDQYAVPVFANLLLLAIPIIFVGALLVYRQRGPVLILLCLFTAMPLWSGMTHWYKSEQRNHWFGYWFGHDMFTPPFTDTNGQLSYDNARRSELLKDPAQARLIYPEMARNTILFGGTDPGRFCPTYIIFCESFIPHRCQPVQDQKFDRRDVYIITQNALADGTYLDYLRAQYNRSKQIDPPFFSELSKYLFTLFLGQDRADDGLTALVNKALYNVLDRPFTAWGAYVEKYRRAQGVYPPNEIYIPSPEDSQKSFEDYTQDVYRRQQIGQLKQGEDVHVENGRVQVSGQVAVMNINGLLCRVIFDNNPTNEFYVEESFPLDWMYPYETPFGVIMKINRQPLAELTQDVFDLDHAFWTKYSARLCGNWITYDTSVQQIADFVERTYIHNNYQGYTGDRAFVRDDDAQKAFSKLRSSQAGMYAWRCFPKSANNPSGCPPEFCQKSPASQTALIRETDFAFKQAFAYCPYSPEAVFRYINFLLQLGRFDDAIVVAQTCQKLDPYNDQVAGLIDNLNNYKKQSAGRNQAVAQLDQMEATARTNPADARNLITLGGAYYQMQQTNRAVELFHQALDVTNLSLADITTLAQCFAQLSDFPRLKVCLEKMTALVPKQPGPRYDLAALESVMGQAANSLQDLKLALQLNAALRVSEPTAPDLITNLPNDPRFNPVRSLPDFQKLLPAK